jgi:hypothetical protein
VIDADLPVLEAALYATLRKLGRHPEARAHAEAILAREPDVAGHRERFARLFG